VMRYAAEKEGLESRDKEPDKRAPETAKVLTGYRAGGKQK